MKFFFLSILALFTADPVIAQWSTNPNENLQVAVHGGNIHVVPDERGSAIITFNNFDYDVVTTYLQCVNKYGYLKWNEPKIIVDSPGPENYANDIFLRNDSSLLVGYISGYDYIDTNLVQHYIYDPYVQRLDSNGSKLWGDNGIRLNIDSTGKHILGRNFCYDSDGGVFAFWRFVYGFYSDTLFIQHIKRDGNRLWGDNGIIIDENIIDANNSWIVYDDNGGIFIHYHKRNTEYYIRKYDSLGTLNWTLSVPNSISTAIKDGQGGIIGSWVKTISPRQLRINRISYGGEKLWGEEGLLVDDSVGANYAYALLLLNQDSTVSVFWSTDWWPTDDLFLQRYTLDGEQVWQEHLKVSEYISPKGRAGIIKSDNNSNIILWGETRDSSVLYAQKVDEIGNKLWNNEDVPIMSHSSYDEPTVITDGNDGAIIVWRIDPPWGGIYAQQISKDGNLGEIITSVKENDNNTEPGDYYLGQNYPNPFNPITKINYSIPYVGASLMKPVQLKIYDILGREIATLVNEEKQPGVYEIDFDGTGLTSGIYFYQLQACNFRATKKLILLK